MARDQEQRLVPAHAPADRVDPFARDAHPRQGGPHDRRHTREIVDMPAPAPRVQRQPPPHPARAHDHERPAPGEVTPQTRIHDGRHSPPVRRDHQRQRRSRALRAKLTRRKHDRRPRQPVMGAVANRPLPGHRRRRPSLANGRRLNTPTLAQLGCRGGRTRTCNPRFWRPVLCQLSYAPGQVPGLSVDGKWRVDLLRPRKVEERLIDAFRVVRTDLTEGRFASRGGLDG